jgi:hypothetical protein
MATRGDVIVLYEAFSRCDSEYKGGLCKTQPNAVTHLFWSSWLHRASLISNALLSN